MRAVNLRMIGRWGNTLFQFCFAKAYCELYECELRTDPWVGEKIFNINNARIQEPFQEYHSELDYVPGKANFEFRGYFQSQKSLIYTRKQVQEWLTWNPKVVELLDLYGWDDKALCHLRRGDYFGYGYPVVSLRSYNEAVVTFGLPDATHISEEQPTRGFGPSFLADFWRLSNTPIMLRANSSFSWWAATLAKNQRTFAPVIEGLEGGKEHDVEFVEGNWPRFANLDFVTDLHLE